MGHLRPRYRIQITRPYCPAVIGFAASLVEVIGFAASLVEEIKEIKEIFIPLGEAVSAISAGLLVSHADSIYCPTEIKEIAEIIVTGPAKFFLLFLPFLPFLWDDYYLMRIVFYCPDFYCLAEIKEIKEILLPPRCAALSAISAISAGRLLPHADSSFIVPIFIVPQK